MAENIYLFGAGVNKVIEDLHGLTPPLANDVFQVAAKLHRFDHDNYQPVYDYIQQIWHYDKSRPPKGKGRRDSSTKAFLVEVKMIHPT